MTDGAEGDGAEHEKTFYIAKWDSFITWKFLNVGGMLLPLFNYALFLFERDPPPLPTPPTSSSPFDVASLFLNEINKETRDAGRREQWMFGLRSSFRHAEEVKVCYLSIIKIYYENKFFAEADITIVFTCAANGDEGKKKN